MISDLFYCTIYGSIGEREGGRGRERESESKVNNQTMSNVDCKCMVSERLDHILTESVASDDWDLHLPLESRPNFVGAAVETHRHHMVAISMSISNSDMQLQ
jgi:hypothetical protein